MTAIEHGQRTIPTWLTAAVGLMLLVAAVVMMVAAAPSREHPQRPPAVTRVAAPPSLCDKRFLYITAVADPSPHLADVGPENSYEVIRVAMAARTVG